MFLESLIYPPCAECHRPSKNFLCEDCLQAHSLQNFCVWCGEELHAEECARRIPGVHEILVRYSYRDSVARYLQDIKERRRPELWRELLFFPEPELTNFDGIVYVPSDPQEIRRRVFDHAFHLAEYFSKKYKISLLSGVLTRHPFLVSQKSLSLADRLEFLRKTIVPGPFFDRPITQRFKRLLLVDDVMTSGASVLRCSEVLSSISDQVVVYCIARTLARQVRIEDK